MEQHAHVRGASRRPPRSRPFPGPDDSGISTGDRFRAYRTTGDRDLRNALVEEHRHLADMAARRFASRGEPLADLLQVAMLGLVKAVDRYDPSLGASFSSFAMPTLLGELRRHFRDATWPVHVTRRAQELHLALSAALEQLHHDLGRSPTPAELASAMGTSVDDVLVGLEAGNAYRTGSIDPGPNEDAEERAVLAVDDGELANADARLQLEPALGQLPDRAQRILRLRFFEQRTQAEIGGIVGLSQVQVSRILRSSLERLHEALASAS